MSRNHQYYAEAGLGQMLRENGSAKHFFISLPDYVQGMIEQRAASIHTEDELHRFAENLLAGDK